MTVPLTYSIFDEVAYIGTQHKSSSQGILNPIQDLQDTPIFTRRQFGTLPNQSAAELSPRVKEREKNGSEIRSLTFFPKRYVVAQLNAWTTGMQKSELFLVEPPALTFNGFSDFSDYPSGELTF